MPYYVDTTAKPGEYLVLVKLKAACSKAYEDFEEWRVKTLLNDVVENILLPYFEDLVFFSNSYYFNEIFDSQSQK